MLQNQGAKIDKVLNFAIDDAILEERITGRWTHQASGRTYHSKFAPPKVPGIDDVSEVPYYCLFLFFVLSSLFLFIYLIFGFSFLFSAAFCNIHLLWM